MPARAPRCQTRTPSADALATCAPMFETRPKPTPGRKTCIDTVPGRAPAARAPSRARGDLRRRSGPRPRRRSRRPSSLAARRRTRPLPARHAGRPDAGAAERRDMDVLVAGQRIVSVFADAKALPPAADEARVVDLHGPLPDARPRRFARPPGDAAEPSPGRGGAATQPVRRRDRGARHGRRPAPGERPRARAAWSARSPAPDIVYAALMAGPDFFTDPRTQQTSAGGMAGQHAVDAGRRPAAATCRWPSHARAARAPTAIKLYADMTRRARGPHHRRGAPSAPARAGRTRRCIRPSRREVVAAGVDAISHACLLIREATRALCRASRAAPAARISAPFLKGGSPAARAPVRHDGGARRPPRRDELGLHAAAARRRRSWPRVDDVVARPITRQAWRAALQASAGYRQRGASPATLARAVPPAVRHAGSSAWACRSRRRCARRLGRRRGCPAGSARPAAWSRKLADMAVLERSAQLHRQPRDHRHDDQARSRVRAQRLRAAGWTRTSSTSTERLPRPAARVTRGAGRLAAQSGSAASSSLRIGDGMPTPSRSARANQRPSLAAVATLRLVVVVAPRRRHARRPRPARRGIAPAPLTAPSRADLALLRVRHRAVPLQPQRLQHPVEVRQHVLERRHPFQRAGPVLDRAFEGDGGVELGQRPQLRPHAGVGAAHQPHAIPLLQPQQHAGALAALELARLDGKPLGRARRAALAHRVHRARVARRPADGADRGAQIHQALRVGGHRGVQRLAGGRVGQQVGGDRPQRLLGRRLRDVAVVREHAREHALDVAVEDRHALAEAERRDRRGRRPADAGQLGQLRARCAETRRRARRPRPARSGAGCGRGRSSPGRSTARARPRTARRPAPATVGKRCRKRS